LQGNQWGTHLVFCGGFLSCRRFDFAKGESAWYLTVKKKGTQKQIRLLMTPNTREGRQEAEEIAIQELATRKIEPQIPSVHSWITCDLAVLFVCFRLRSPLEQKTVDDQYQYATAYRERQAAQVEARDVAEADQGADVPADHGADDAQNDRQDNSAWRFVRHQKLGNGAGNQTEYDPQQDSHGSRPEEQGSHFRNAKSLLRVVLMPTIRLPCFSAALSKIWPF
jgi:hypothetical protein